MNREPAALIGAVSVAVQAILSCIVAFGLDITDDQQAGILGAIASIGTLITALLIRGKVYAPATRDADVAAAGRHLPDAA